MREMLDEKLDRFEELERQLVDPDVLSNAHRLAAVAREHGSLANRKEMPIRDAAVPWRQPTGSLS